MQIPKSYAIAQPTNAWIDTRYFNKALFTAVALACLGTGIIIIHRNRAREKRERVIALLQLLENWQHSGVENRVKVLDLRSEKDVEHKRIRGAHCISYRTLWEENRWHELPDKHEPLALVLPSSESKVPEMENSVRSRRPNIIWVLTESDLEGWKFLEDKGLVLSGPVEDDELVDTLFSPLPFLKDCVNQIESGLQELNIELSCFDAGCGSGRDSVWLGQRGWNVTGIDSWQVAVDRTKKLALKWGVLNRVTALQGKIYSSGKITFMDSSSEKKQEREFKGETFGLVMVIRFLERGALDSLSSLVCPQGGYFLHCTFQVEQDGTFPHFSPKRLDKVLLRNELSALFTEKKGWHVCIDSEYRLHDGRPLNCFLARKIEMR